MYERLIMNRQAISVSALGFVLLFAFQNCAPANFEMASEKAGTNGGYDLTTPDELVVAKACDGQIYTQTANVSFPRPQKQYNGSRCNWSNAGNGGTDNGHFQARYEQTQNVSLPANAKVCDIQFKANTQSWLYDDHVFLAMDDVLLASSHPIHEDLQKQNGLTMYDWSRIFKKNWSQIPAYVWCEGLDKGLSSCDWSASETQGSISLAFAPELFQKIGARDLARTQHEFRFITTGDNDTGVDCDHSDLNFDVTISYAY